MLSDQEFMKAVIREIVDNNQRHSSEIADILGEDIVRVARALKALEAQGYCQLYEALFSNIEVLRADKDRLKNLL